MNTQIGQWGNSLAVRIPGTYAKELQLRDSMELTDWSSALPQFSRDAQRSALGVAR